MTLVAALLRRSRAVGDDDRVTLTLSGSTARYEVAQPETGQPHWSFSGAQQLTLLVGFGAALAFCRANRAGGFEGGGRGTDH